jgi:hypothetical protein
VCERVTGWHDHGSPEWKRSVKIRAVLRRGTGATDDSNDVGVLEVRVQDDDKGWSEWDGYNIGGPGQFENVVDIFLGGVFRRRRYHFRLATTEVTALAEVYDDVVTVADSEKAA